MPDNKQCCGTCRWWNQDVPPVLVKGEGWCLAPVPDAALIDDKNSTRATEGTTCPAWAEKEEIEK